MSRQTSFQPIQVDEWIALSNKEVIIRRICDSPYSKVYGILCAHFKNLESISWDDAVLGLHLVYGWMPTIPDLSSIVDWEGQRKDKLPEILASAKAGQELSNEDMALLASFSNNSIIGASKLLHFLNPSKFPIWDSRVANVFFGLKKVEHYQVNHIQHWHTYQGTLTNWLEDINVTDRCLEIKDLADHLHDVSDLRMIELVLFHTNESKRKGKKRKQS